MHHHQNKTLELEFYNKFAAELKDTYPDKLYQDVFLLSNLSVNKPCCILEAGCGAGYFGRRLSKIGHTVTGVDLSPRMIEKATKDAPENFKALVGDLEKRQLFNKGQFDIVFFGNSLHHFPNYKRVISNANYWLKAGGKIIIIEPNGSNPINFISKLIGRILLKIFGTQKSLGTPNEINLSFGGLKKHLAENNFKIIKNEPYIYFYPKEVLDREVKSFFIRHLVFLRDFIYRVGWLILPRVSKGIMMIVVALKINGGAK